MKLKLYAEVLKNLYEERRPLWDVLEKEGAALRDTLSTIRAKSPDAIGGEATQEAKIEELLMQIEANDSKKAAHKKETRRLIEDIESDFKKDLDEAFLPDGNALDDSVIRAIGAGIQYTPQELKVLEDKYSKNPTMHRVLYDYVRRNNIFDGNGVPVVVPQDVMKGKVKKEWEEACRFVLWGAGGSPLWRWESLSPVLQDLTETLTLEEQ